LQEVFTFQQLNYAKPSAFIKAKPMKAIPDTMVNIPMR